MHRRTSTAQLALCAAIAGLKITRFASATPPTERSRWAVLSGVTVEYQGEDAVMCTATDITEQHRAQEILTAAKVQAEAVANAKSDYLAVMSHEIRTPMNGILGMVQLLAGTHLSQSQRVYVDTIQRSGESLLRLVDDIMDLSRIEAGTVTIACEPFDPRELLEDVAGLLRSAAVSKGLILDVDVADDIPSLLTGDAARITQVLFHLTSNAVKLTERGGVHLRLRNLGTTGTGALRTQFTVEDSGPGIPETAQKRLFQQFGVGDASLSRAHGGAGLGLAICKGLVDAMGGIIDFETVSGQGTTFRVHLDLSDAEANAGSIGSPPPSTKDGAARLTHLSRRALPPPPDSGKPLRLLLVEDEKVNRMLATELLRRDGQSVKAVDNGLDGVAEAARGDYDVVLMDLHMPGIDGTEAIRRIRALPDPARANVPIVVLTADITDASHQTARDSGADAVVSKPFRLDLLKRVMTDLLRENAAATGAALPEAGPAAPTARPSAQPLAPPDNARRVSPDPSLVPPGSLLIRQWDELGPAAVTELIDLFRNTTRLVWTHCRAPLMPGTPRQRWRKRMH